MSKEETIEKPEKSKIDEVETNTEEVIVEKDAKASVEEATEEATEEVDLKDDTETKPPVPAKDEPKTPAKDEPKKQANDEFSAETNPPLPTRKKHDALAELKDAFPHIEEKYIKAVLIASRGSLDPAFEALLYISDPSYEPEIPAPRVSTPPVRSHNHQLDQDEELARQLDRQFNRGRVDGNSERRAREARIRERERQFNERYGQQDEDDFLTNFVDKDLPQIRENLNRNIGEAGEKLNVVATEAKQKFGQWFSGFAGKFNEPEQKSYQQDTYFNSFGQRGDDYNDERMSNEHEVPPKLPTRSKKADVTIDTPVKKEWQPVKIADPEPLDDDFLINSDDELREAK